MGMPLEPSHCQPNDHVDNWQKPQSSPPKEWFPLRLLGLQVLQPVIQPVAARFLIINYLSTACLGPQPNHHNCSLIISLPHWRWKRAKNSKSGTARTCSNGVMALMGSKNVCCSVWFVCLSSRPNYKVNWRRECQNCCSCLYYFNIR